MAAGRAQAQNPESAEVEEWEQALVLEKEREQAPVLEQALVLVLALEKEREQALEREQAPVREREQVLVGERAPVREWRVSAP